MYVTLKKLIRQFFPNSLLFRVEPAARFAYALFYSGNRFQCVICKKRLRKFITLSNGNRLCPKCGSSDRDRKLWDILSKNYLKRGDSILDFSPSRPLFRKMETIPYLTYTSTDLSGDFVSHKSHDITSMDTESGQFDLIVCYHVLEHVDEDRKAMAELYRVLKPNGVCIIQTPFKEGEIYENSEVITKKERLTHFGQEDHVRIYSVGGLKERLQETGFEVDTVNTSEEKGNRYGFKPDETILICSK